MRDMKDFALFVLIIVLLAALLNAYERRPDRYEWTYDGVHHVLRFGKRE